MNPSYSIVWCLAIGIAGMGLTGCGEQPASAPAAAANEAAPASAPAHHPDSTEQFLLAIREHCGKAYRGKVLVDRPAAEPNAFSTAELVMHVRDCGEEVIRIPFMVGEDRSRTWVLTRTKSGLRLKHDHRHEDGSADAVTLYGGDSDDQGSAQRQQFPVDDESIENFQANGLEASVNNTWALEIESDQRFLYELSRPGGRLFQVEFDLSNPVTAPPPPWGWQADGPQDSGHHDDHHHHHAQQATLELNAGEPWATDQALREGMQRIRTAVDGAQPPLTNQAAAALAAEIDASIIYLIENCELEPAADANLHILLAEISAAAAALKQPPIDADASTRIRHALARYGEYFDHPDWQ